MSEGKFYTPEEVKPLYDQIVPTYQEAFAGEPWYEVSKCIDEFKRCAGGLSELQIGDMCSNCGICPEKPAYEQQELESRFDNLGLSRPTSWYVEEFEGDITMVAVAWKANLTIIANEKYADVPEMSKWLVDKVGQDQIIWLDEVFANRKLRPTGNLRNFGEMVTGLATKLDSPLVAYRTISPQMKKASRRDLGALATVSAREFDVPDRRDFVVIDLSGSR